MGLRAIAGVAAGGLRDWDCNRHQVGIDAKKGYGMNRNPFLRITRKVGVGKTALSLPVKAGQCVDGATDAPTLSSKVSLTFSFSSKSMVTRPPCSKRPNSNSSAKAERIVS